MFREQLRIAVSIFSLLTILTGVVYPSLVTGIAQSLFHQKSNGSLISLNGKIIGSSLIGQPFDNPQYMWGRPSATLPTPYNAASSSGANLGPSNSALLDAAKARVVALHSAEPHNNKPIPVDLVTYSGSGLDPHISLAGAYYQISRIAKTRGLSEVAVKAVIQRNARGRLFDVIGEPTINVLRVNLDLDIVSARYLQKYNPSTSLRGNAEQLSKH